MSPGEQNMKTGTDALGTVTGTDALGTVENDSGSAKKEN
jgi:hypothetical protein